MESDRNFLMNEYYKRKAETFAPRYRFNGSGKSGFDSWKNSLLPELKKALGPIPEPVDLNPEIICETEEDDIVKRRIIIDLEEDMSAPIWLYIPKKAFKTSAPAILCCHGHGQFGKDSVMGVKIANYPEREAEIKKFNYDYGLQMAKRGYVTIAVDWRGFGERSEGNAFYGKDECNMNYIKAGLLGYNLLALDIFDGIRCIDYLCGLDFVDSERIGCMGLSFGGTMTTWLTLMDERIKAADIICYSARFSEFALKRGNFCGSQTFMGIYKLCDVPDLHGLIAPRPLLAEIGMYDLCFKSDEALSCAKEVEKIYTAAGVQSKYVVDFFEGGHAFSGRKAFDFFEKCLKR